MGRDYSQKTPKNRQKVGFVVTEAPPERVILVKVSEDSQVQKALLEAASRIPERFLITPSQAAGINVKDFIDNNPQVKKHLENIQSSKLFQPLDMLDTDGFKNFMEDCDLPERYLWSGFQLHRKTGLEKAKQILAETAAKHRLSRGSIPNIKHDSHTLPTKRSSITPGSHSTKMPSVKCISNEPDIPMQTVQCSNNEALVKNVTWATN